LPPGAGSVRLSDFGTDLHALQDAVAAAAHSPTRTLVIDAEASICMSSVNDPIRLPSGFTLEFAAGSCLTWDAFGLPLFWGMEVEDVTIVNPTIYFSGMARPTLPSVTRSFYANLNRGRDQAFAAQNVMGAFAFFGANNIEWRNPRFRAVDFSASERLMPRSIVLSDFSDGRTSKNIRILGEIELDGVNMGPLMWGVEGVEIGDVTSKRRGQLDPAVYGWEVAGHAVYISAASQNYDVTVGRCRDEGPPVPGTYMGNDPASFKFRRIHRGSVAGVSSRWPSGALEWCTTGEPGGEFHFGPIEWHGRANADMARAGPINMPNRLGSGKGASGEAAHTIFSTMDLYCPADMNNYVITNDVSLGSQGDTVSHVDFGTVTIHYPGRVQGAVRPLVGGSMSHCRMTLILQAPNWTVAAARVINIDNGGSDNRFEITVPGRLYPGAYVHELYPSSRGNTAIFRRAGSAETRSWGSAR
jgi:hypothetical protein